MNTRTLGLLLFFAAASCTTPAARSDAIVQDPAITQRKLAADPLESLNGFFDEQGFRLRRRAGGKHTLAQPAQVNAVKTAGRPNSQVSVDAALTWDPSFLQFSDVLEVSVFAEMHKNTALLPQKQEAYLFGAMGTMSFSEDGIDTEDFELHVDGTVALKTDKYTDYGLFLKAAASPVIPVIGAGERLEWDDAALIWVPQIGFNFESAEDVFPSDLIGGPRYGNVLRFLAGVHADFYPMRESTGDRLWVHTAFTYWGQVAESGGFKRTSDNEHLFRFAVNYALDAAKSVVIGFSYSSGGNPEIGLRPEDFLALQLGVRLGGFR